MVTPYDLFIRFLATKGLDDINEINAELSKLSLFAIEQADLDKQWELLHSNLTKRLMEQLERKCYEPDFRAAMKMLDVDGLWVELPDTTDKAAVKAVYDIHQDIVLKITLNALLIKQISPMEITRMLNTKFSFPLKETHVDLYMRFFFDPRRMRRSNWKEYLKKCSNREKKIYFTALTESDAVLKTELDLPAVVNVSESIQWLFTKSFLKAKTYMDVGTPEADKSAIAWTDQVVRLADKYEKYRSGDQNDFAKVLQMEFDFVDEPFETPDDVTYKEVTSKNRTEE